MAHIADGTSIAELALEAWLDCKPHGFVLDELRVPAMMPAIAARLKVSKNQKNMELYMLFERPPQGGDPVFLQLLKVQGAEVHFLYFWRAFGEVARMVGADSEEGLVLELETFRDRLLRRLEELAAGRAAAGPPLPTQTLVQEVLHACSMSKSPPFWQSVMGCLQTPSTPGEWSLKDLTEFLLVWLRFAPLWEFSDGGAAGAGAPADSLVVRVNIYDVSQEEGIQKINKVFANKRAPLKLGGIFHAAVEINGLEWSYGYMPIESRSGIACHEPRKDPQHHYRQTVTLRRSRVAPEDIPGIISDLVEDYPGNDYDLLRRNCCHFADDFCRRLGAGGIPGWIHRLARLGAKVDNVLQITGGPLR